eukprot:CAMPEP_0176351432 /NCGR_PEP_ID=MMETSP0126-20121128/10235_1 /TAXON_ID=141414 ORGANISM="Strombidinopsis acuminatum, Strain SPMC142" /NCGR_SAMPLE_ID=MMETSP0126 /ASSEMBLY_ACC=CAM_ASM_000229 /LENGTH=50 /DNA_ID=CAMNT_0017701969 /DNA_START=439 /DNA_END=591 /DNA_ORIENTATION=+
MAFAGQYMAMSEDEWNKIVLQNLQAHKDEEVKRKNKLIEQQRVIKAELSK